MRVCPTGRARLVGLLVFFGDPYHTRSVSSCPLLLRQANDSHSERAPTPHRPWTPTPQTTKLPQGYEAGEDILDVRFPRFPRLGLSDLTTRLSMQSGPFRQV